MARLSSMTAMGCNLGVDEIIPSEEEAVLDRFLKFYSMVGIKLEPSPDKNELGNTVYLVGADSHYGDRDKDDRFDGYTCFYSDIEFTKEGEFVRQGFWE